MSISVDILPTLNVVQISVDGQMVFVRRESCTEFLAKFMRAMAESIPDPQVADVIPLHERSVKVPDDYLGPTDLELYGAGSQ